jgi:hypothetical protein
MKKSVLLLMLLPFFALAQTTLVQWKGYNGANTATNIDANITGGTITTTGINFNNTQWNGFQASGWPTSSTPDASKYIQFTVTPKSGYQIALDNFNFQYIATDGGASKITIQYSYAADFSNPVTILNDETPAVGVTTDKTVSFNGATVLNGKTLYVRIYGYARGNQWYDGAPYIINHTDGNGNGAGNAGGPFITGKLEASGGGVVTLKGSYLISATDTKANFKSITEAVASLNKYGVSGPVTFLLSDATYSNATETFPITIKALTGTSATNTVTFKPAAGKIVNIEAVNVLGHIGVPAVFKLDGADFITFDGSNAIDGTTRNLTINNKDGVSESDRTVIWVASGTTDASTNITVKNCVIKQSNKNSAGRYALGIYSGKTGTGTNLNIEEAPGNNSNLTVTNNKFTNIKQGVYVNGGVNVTTGLLINKNDIGAENNLETSLSPATINNVNGFEYSDNYIYNIYRDNNNSSLASSGVTVIGASANGSILRNNMKDLTKATIDSQLFAGIVLGSTSVNANILVANNFILNVAGANVGAPEENGHGIAVTNGGGYKIYHNTVSLNTNQTGSLQGYSSALYISNSAKNLDVRNNIFSNNQTGTTTRRTAITIVNTPDNINAVFTNLDNNVYWSNDRIGYISATNGLGNVTDGSNNNTDYFVTLEAFKRVTGKDVKSINVLPGFVSAKDLHIDANNTVNAKLNDGGIVLTEVKKDIDGQLRSTTATDMGADEFGAIASPNADQTTGIYCNETTTWNGTAWSNGTPDANKDVIFNGAYTAKNTTLYACSVHVINNANVNFVGNATAVVTHSVNVSSTASLTFESSSNLIQIEDDANTGIVVVKRNSSKLKRLDYTLWAAPVYDSRATGYQSLLAFSPQTATNRFYNYNTLENNYSPIATPAATKFAKGKSILIRMPNADSAPGYNEGNRRLAFEGSFEGTPNNGTIRVALPYAGATTSYSAVGNPYPSPLNVTEFISQNLDVIDGTLWLWRKTNDNTKSSYATITLGGYVANSAPGGSAADNDLLADPYTIVKEGSLNTAQGFIVKATSANKEVVFNNSMRLQTNSNAFFRGVAETEEAALKSDYDRVWFNVASANDEFTQTLVAYNDKTTLGYDKGYDGASFLNGGINFYSVLKSDAENINLAIQVRGKFNLTDAVVMGFKAVNAGTYTLSIDHTDGLLAANDTNILIVDNLTGTTKNLKDGSYTFTSEAGTFENRFKVVYASKSAEGALDTNTPDLQAKQVMVYKSDRQVNVQAPSDIKSVVVYDVLGKVLFQKNNIGAQTFATSDINAGQQVIIVNVTLDNNAVISKKIMN